MYHADLLGGLAAKLAGPAPVVWNIRNLSFDPARPNRLTQALVRVAALLSGLIPAAIVTNSLAAQNEHVRLGYAKDKVQVIPNGFDLAVYAPNPAGRAAVRRELGIRPDELLVGLLARFDPLKDHLTFVAAAAKLLEQFKQARFLLAGTGITPDNQILQQAIQNTGAESAFHLLGSRHDVPNLLAALDLFVSSSISESFPNAVGEAMAAGVACVVTDAGDSRRLVAETGMVVPSRDAAALAQACAQVLALSPAERTQRGLVGRQRIQSHYTLQAMVERYAALYESLPGNKP
jgi:glycosyltransferase involved in cell wall biosynthesis